MKQMIWTTAAIAACILVSPCRSHAQDRSPATRTSNGWEVRFHFPNELQTGRLNGVIIQFRKSLIGAMARTQKLHIVLKEADRAGLDETIRTYYHDARCNTPACGNGGWKRTRKGCVRERKSWDIEATVDLKRQELRGSVLYYTDWGRYEKGLRRGNLEIYAEITARGITRNFTNKKNPVVIPMKKR